MGSQQRRHDLLYTVVRGTRIHTKEGERLSSIVSCTWSGSRCATMGLHRSRETHKNTRSSRSTCARLLSGIDKWGQMVMNAHLSPLVDDNRGKPCHYDTTRRRDLPGHGDRVIGLRLMRIEGRYIGGGGDQSRPTVHWQAWRVMGQTILDRLLTFVGFSGPICPQVAE